jgi:hypothetical protein
MGKGARLGVAVGLVAAAGAGCSLLAGIEDLQLTGSPDGAPDAIGAQSDATLDTGGSSSGAEAGGGADSQSDGGVDSEASTSSDAGAGSDAGGCGGFLVCDGFESDSINPAIWQPFTTGGASVTVDNTAAHRGNYALHVHVGAVDGGFNAGRIVWLPHPFPSNLLYIRAWYSLSALPGPDSDIILTLVSGANAQAARGEMGFQQAGRFFAGVSNTTPASFDYTNYSAPTTTFPTGVAPRVWTCIQLQVDTTYAAPNPNGLLQVWHDGTQDPQGGTAELQPLTGVIFGLEFSVGTGTTNPVDLYVDDVAIDTNSIACSQ